jgi:hypothetical protein
VSPEKKKVGLAGMKAGVVLNPPVPAPSGGEGVDGGEKDEVTGMMSPESLEQR